MRSYFSFFLRKKREENEVFYGIIQKYLELVAVKELALHLLEFLTNLSHERMRLIERAFAPKFFLDLDEAIYQEFLRANPHDEFNQQWPRYKEYTIIVMIRAVNHLGRSSKKYLKEVVKRIRVFAQLNPYATRDLAELLWNLLLNNTKKILIPIRKVITSQIKKLLQKQAFASLVHLNFSSLRFLSQLIRLEDNDHLSSIFPINEHTGYMKKSIDTYLNQYQLFPILKHSITNTLLNFASRTPVFEKLSDTSCQSRPLYQALPQKKSTKRTKKKSRNVVPIIQQE
uniref:Uncharacterized protein n=1 Tax=Aureoumbra lagunensis TaxID=44058 RepID=A0A7S3JV31_9STRA